MQGRPTQRIDPQRLSTVAHCSLQFLRAQSINGANVFLLLNFAVFSLPASIAQDIENGQRVCSFLLPTVVNRTSLLQVLGDGHQVALLLLDHFQLFLPGCLLFLVARTGPFQFQVSFGQQLQTRERGVVFSKQGGGVDGAQTLHQGQRGQRTTGTDQQVQQRTRSCDACPGVQCPQLQEARRGGFAKLDQGLQGKHAIRAVVHAEWVLVQVFRKRSHGQVMRGFHQVKDGCSGCSGLRGCEKFLQFHRWLLEVVERQQSFQRNVFGRWVMVKQQLTRGKQCIVQGGSGDQQDMQGQLTLGIEHGRAGWIKRHEQLCRSCECRGGQGGVSKEAMERCTAGRSGDKSKRCLCRDLGQDLIELVDVGGGGGGGGGGEVVQEWVVGYRGDGVEAGQLTKSDRFVFRVGDVQV